MKISGAYTGSKSVLSAGEFNSNLKYLINSADTLYQISHLKF